MLRQQLTHALGQDIGVACTGIEGDIQWLWPTERAGILQAVPRRQREFAAGRSAAREALVQIGHPPTAIPSALDRSPVWPDGIVGSIAHTRVACVAMAGRRDQAHALGVDIEEDLPLPPALWETICTPQERRTAASLSASDQGSWVMRLFCAKEAYYKWQYRQTRCVLDFRDVQVTLDLNCSGFRVEPSTTTAHPVVQPRREGRIMSSQGLVLAWLIGAPA